MGSFVLLVVCQSDFIQTNDKSSNEQGEREVQDKKMVAKAMQAHDDIKDRSKNNRKVSRSRHRMQQINAEATKITHVKTKDHRTDGKRTQKTPAILSERQRQCGQLDELCQGSQPTDSRQEQHSQINE